MLISGSEALPIVDQLAGLGEHRIARAELVEVDVPRAPRVHLSGPNGALGHRKRTHRLIYILKTYNGYIIHIDESRIPKE